MKAKASLGVIQNAWDSLYGVYIDGYDEWAHMPGEHSCRICINVLLCFAVYHDHGALVDELLPNCSMMCDFRPWITTIHMKKIAPIEAVPNDMIPQIFLDSYDRRVSLTCFGREAYGIIIDDVLTAEKTTALTIILNRDDHELLQQLILDIYNGSLAALADRARLYAAPQCLKVIMGKMDLFTCDVGDLSYNALARNLNGIVESCASYHGITTQLQRDSAMHVWTSLTRSGFGADWERQLLSNDDELAVAQHLNICSHYGSGEKTSSNTADEPINIYCCQSSLQLHQRIVVETCLLLLHRMSKTMEAKPIIPSDVFIALIDKVYVIFTCIPFISDSNIDMCSNTMEMFNIITRIFVKSGVKSGGMLFPAKDTVLLHLNILFGMGKCMPKPPNKAQSEMLALIHEHIMIFLVYK